MGVILIGDGADINTSADFAEEECVQGPNPKQRKLKAVTSTRPIDAEAKVCYPLLLEGVQ